MNKFYLKDIDKIVVVDVIQFWPGEVVISESGPTDNFSPEHSSELIYLCNFNNHYYHLFNFTGSTLNESFKNNLINKIQKDKINTDEFQQYLLDKKQVLYSAFNK